MLPLGGRRDFLISTFNDACRCLYFWHEGTAPPPRRLEWRCCGFTLPLPGDTFSVLSLERPDLVCIPAQGVTVITAGGAKTDRANRWSLQNEMKLQWSILFVTHPQNRNNYGLLATKVMDIECLLTVGLWVPLVKLLHGVNWILHQFYLLCIWRGRSDAVL